MLEAYYATRGGRHRGAAAHGAGARGRRADREPRCPARPASGIGNIFILAGVPHIATLMLEALSGQLEGGRPLLSRTIGCWVAGERGRRPAAARPSARIPAARSAPIPSSAKAGSAPISSSAAPTKARSRPARRICSRGSKRPGARSSPRASEEQGRPDRLTAASHWRRRSWTASSPGSPAGSPSSPASRSPSSSPSASILVWGVTGPMFGFSDTWQLVINTGTTIVTFLMVFLIQNSHNRDAAAMQAKLDELLRAVEQGARRVHRHRASDRQPDRGDQGDARGGIGEPPQPQARRPRNGREAARALLGLGHLGRLDAGNRTSA